MVEIIVTGPAAPVSRTVRQMKFDTETYICSSTKKLFPQKFGLLPF